MWFSWMLPNVVVVVVVAVFGVGVVKMLHLQFQELPKNGLAVLT